MIPVWHTDCSYSVHNTHVNDGMFTQNPSAVDVTEIKGVYIALEKL